jgi:hypothetical protein
MPNKRTITFIPRVPSPRPISFDSSTVIIGSRDDADLVLDDSAEPVHALIRMRDDSIELAAFGPLELNGVLVERATLAEGDHIRIGRLSFVFVTTEAEAAAEVSLPHLAGALAGSSGDADLKQFRTEVALYCGGDLLQIAHYEDSATVKIGEGAGNHFLLAARELKEKSFDLVQPSAEGPVVHVPSLAPVELDTKGIRSARGALIDMRRLVDDRLVIGTGEKVAIALEAMTIVVRRVPGATVVTQPVGERIHHPSLARSPSPASAI